MQSEVNQEENLNRIITVPNLLSFFRLCLIPVIIWSYCVKKNPLLAGEILLLSGLTDLADGYIARRFHRISNLMRWYIRRQISLIMEAEMIKNQKRMITQRKMIISRTVIKTITRTTTTIKTITKTIITTTRTIRKITMEMAVRSQASQLLLPELQRQLRAAL